MINAINRFGVILDDQGGVNAPGDLAGVAGSRTEAGPDRRIGAGPVVREGPGEAARLPDAGPGSPVRMGAGSQLNWIETSSRTNEVCRDWSSTDVKSRVTV